MFIIHGHPEVHFAMIKSYTQLCNCMANYKIRMTIFDDSVVIIYIFGKPYKINLVDVIIYWLIWLALSEMHHAVVCAVAHLQVGILTGHIMRLHGLQISSKKS